ncbi:tRNA(adenine(34)) deaminase, chloroplastic [Ziziphus jujuba]|uniref:tRNA(adenine(34)) deaminase n=1 Tax=Ziziphus jujuba TaxID=326968 RepID=A0A6P6GJA7_ZIZJJ|nr:tRNA(adenine(34)) deaminase, chloroplastic [Ziziphus jujuba]
MLNSYISSGVYSFGSNGSLPFSFSDYSYCLNERYERNPIHKSSSCCCHCCASCAFPIHRVSINPGFLYGLRQSSLLQWPASRKLILGVDRYYHRIPVYGIDQGCYEVSSSSLKEKRIYNTTAGRRKGRCCCMVEQGSNEIYHSSRFDGAEALINLLSEEVDEEYFGGKSRNGISHKRLAVERRVNSGRRERNLNSFEKVQLEKKEKYSSKCNNGKKKSDGLSNSKHVFEPVAIESREEDSKRNDERGVLTRSDNRRGLRKEDSSCSSYYSLSSIQDFDSETEVHDKHEQEESFTGYKDSGWKGEGTYDGALVQKHKIIGDGEEEHVKVSEQRKNAVGGVAEWDWRNKSEKKLADTLVEERQSSREHSGMHTRVSGTHESNYGKASSSYKRFSDEEENSALTVTLEEGTRKQYAQKGNQGDKVPTTSRRKFPDNKERSVFLRGDSETSSQQQERYSSRVENLETNVNLIGEAKKVQHSEVSHLTKKESFSRNDKDLRRKSGKDLDTERTFISQRQSEIGMIGWEENAKMVSNSVQETQEQFQHTGQNILGQANLRGKSQQSTETLEACSNIEKASIIQSEIEKASIIQSETTLNSQVRNTNLVSVTCAESINPQRIRSRTGSNDTTAISVAHATGTESIPSSQCASEIKIVNQESNTILIGIAGETGEGSKQTNEKLKQISSRKEDKRPARPSNFYERDLEEASTFQGSLNLVSQTGIQQIGMGDHSSSQAMVMPPPSQLIARSSIQDDSTSGHKAEEVFSTTSDRGSSALNASSRGRHGEPMNVITPDDALGSADRIQKSSMQFVGEFVEKMRHEVSTSEVQKVRHVAETKLTSEEDKLREKSSSPYVSEDFQQKEQHEARSSGGSGTKGPSDEMWDVADPSIRKSPMEEEGEATVTGGNVIVRRSGRSFWNIVSDVVRLRWGSRSETPSSAARSGGKISSNDSVGSEAWFSSREPEENKDKHTKEKGPQSETASDQMQHQGEESGILRSVDKVRYLEAETSFSTNIVDSASTSEGILLPSGDGTLGFNRYGKSVEGTSSDMQIAGLSLPSDARGVRSTIVSEISSTNNDKESSSGLREHMELPAGGNLDEVLLGSEGKDGELKRRKFQRNKQVPKDRFDEWEEAYKLENEQRKIDEMFMREALLEAKKAADTWEVPVGAVLVQHGKIIARGCNLVEELRDSTAHAEMICIREASKLLRTWRLSESTLYVTLEPCPMCAGAILQARVDTLVWGAPNKLLGADGSWIRLFPDGGGNNLELSDKPAAPVHPFHPKMNIRRGILASECADVMQQFFQLRRRKKEKKAEPTPTSGLSISHHPSKFLRRMHDIFHMMFCL